MAEQPEFNIGKTIWPAIANIGGNASNEDQQKLQLLIAQLSEYVALTLNKNGITRFSFPLFRPFNAVFAITNEKIFVMVSTLTGGVALLRYQDWRRDRSAPEVTLEQAMNVVRQQLGWTEPYTLELPISLLDMAPIDRKVVLEEEAQNIAEYTKEGIVRQQRRVRFRPVFRTSLDELESDPSLCFVLMPFKPEFNRIYESVLQPTIKAAGLNPLRADEIFSPTPIVEDIWVHIAKSRLVIADVTDKNPNVFYELGLAHAIGAPVIVITRNKEDIPFDIAYIRYLLYVDNESGWAKLKTELAKALDSILSA
ncbi:MAG: hypothetical protein HY667_06330 [Chloroflexi bacterium]|nr:hypothetical protein [Chloroflexota bacterium]